MREDLLRRALESGKTTSRKARSKQVSAATSQTSSRANSRTASRDQSRQGSEDEDDDSDETGMSNSLDGFQDDEADTNANWQQILTEVIQDITNHSRRNAEQRELDLQKYIRLLRHHYAGTVISKHASALLRVFLKQVRAEASDSEAVLALKALSITVVTDQADDIFDVALSPLKAAVENSESSSVKAQAVRALGIATFYGGASVEATEEVMSSFLEIVESDGNSVDAADDAGVVAAALEEWGFLASQIEDMEQSSETAVEAFVEQLESSDARVQIAAGQNIALLYGKSYTDVEDDDSIPETDDPDATPPTMVERYQPYRRKDQVLHAVESLAKVSSKRLSKRDRKDLHTKFADVAQSVADPTLGPGYSSAIDDQSGASYGSRISVRVSKTETMPIKTWWCLLRLEALKRVLQAGLQEHLERNDVVRETLTEEY